MYDHEKTEYRVGDGWPLRGMILDSRLRGNDSVAMGGTFKRSLWVPGLELIIAY